MALPKKHFYLTFWSLKTSKLKLAVGVGEKCCPSFFGKYLKNWNTPVTDMKRGRLTFPKVEQRTSTIYIYLSSPRAESARAVTGRRNSHRWEGGRLFEPTAGGLKMGHQPKLGSYGKNRIFWPKTEILGPKKRSHFCTLTMFWPRPKKVVQRKKLPLPK